MLKYNYMKSFFLSPLGAAWICWAIVGFSPLIGKWASGKISPVLLVFLGSCLGIIYFLPWIFKNQQRSFLFSLRYFPYFLFIGTFGTALPFTLLLTALHYTTPANAAILQQTELFYAFLFGILLFKEKPSVKQFFAAMLILAGSGFILLQDHYTAHWRGDLLIIGSTWMLQAASCVAKKLPAHFDYRLIAMARNLFAIPALLLLFCIYPFGDNPFFFSQNWETAVILGYTGFIKYGLAMVVWYKAIRALELSKVTAIYLSYPALSLILSTAFGLEKVTLYQLAGLGLTLAGAWKMSQITIKKDD